MVRIRLQRRGRRKKPFYHIVIADSRSPRDGRFIEKVGTYNPMTKPATIDLDPNAAFDWLMKGAQPTDTVRAILRVKGVMYRKHLNRGVLKGALTQEEADAKLASWIGKKEESFANRAAQTAKEVEATRRKVAGVKPKVAEPVVEEAPAPAVEAPAEAAVVEEAIAPAAEEAIAEAASSNPEMQAAVDQAVNIATEEAAPAEAAPSEKDDLTKVEGIGPKIAEVLNSNGVHTFAALAATEPSAIRTMLDEAEGNFKAHVPDTWPQQAQLAADGKWDELKALQDVLDGGKPVEKA